MSQFNRTLAADLASTQSLWLTPKPFLPLNIPQRPEDFSRDGFRLSDWSAKPANAQYLVIGYAAVVGETLVLYAWMLDTTKKDVESARLFGTAYRQPLGDLAGKRLAHSLSVDIVRALAGRPEHLPNR